MWLCGSTGKRDTICHLFSFCYVFSHHPRAGIWERLQALGNIHLNIHLCVFFFLFIFLSLFFSFLFLSLFLFSFFCYLFTIELFTFLSLFLFSPPGAANALQTVIWPRLSLDRHGQPNTQRIALFLAVSVCSTAKRESSSSTRHWRRYRRDGSAHQLWVLTAHLVVFVSGMLQRIM